MSENRLPEMIDYFRKMNGLTMGELGEKLNKSHAAVSYWIRGERSPSFEDLETMIKLFNTDFNTIMYGLNYTQTNVYHHYDKHWIRFPLTYNELMKEPLKSIQLPGFFVSDEYKGQPLVFMRVFSDSLNKIIPKNALIGIFNCSVQELQRNDLVVFNENDDFALKQFIPDNILRPASYDDSFTDFVIDRGDFDIIGKVVVSITNYK